MSRKIFGPKMEEVTAGCRNLMIMFVTALFRKYHSGDEIKWDERGWPCGTFRSGTKLKFALFRVSVAVQTRSALFLDVTQSRLVFSYRLLRQMGRVAQSVYWLVTDWTVRGSNAGGVEIFRIWPDRPWGPPSLLYNGYRVFSGGWKQTGRDADPSPPSSAEV
jgi:hypothetical protein